MDPLTSHKPPHVRCRFEPLSKIKLLKMYGDSSEMFVFKAIRSDPSLYQRPSHFQNGHQRCYYLIFCQDSDAIISLFGLGP